MDEDQLQQTPVEEQQVPEPVQENPQQPTPAVGVRTRGKKKPKRSLVIAIAVVAIVLILGGVFYYLGSRDTSESEATPTPDNSINVIPESPEATATPEAVNREEVKIQVLNGTGISGEAALLKGKLEGLGYSEIEVGNASSQDNETTKVTYSKSLPDATQDEITNQLKDIYKDVDVNTGSTGSFDVKITSGLRKGQTPKAQSTATPKPDGDKTPAPTSTSSPTSTPTSTPTPTPES